MSKPRTEDDSEIGAAAAVIEDLLFLLPPSKPAAALAIATKAEDVARQEREKRGDRLIWVSAADLDKWTDSPECRYWNRIMRLKAKMIYVFVRDIRNNHSKEDTARLLFQQHRNSPGSGRLADYLENRR
jgi:hypothetical protein